MALIRIDPDAINEYVPIAERKNTKDPLYIKCKFVPHRMAVEFNRIIIRAFGDERDRQRREEIEDTCNRDQFLRQVTGVVNFLDTDGKTPITDVGIFYDSVDGILMNELLSAILDQGTLTAGQRKNFTAVSGTDTRPE